MPVNRRTQPGGRTPRGAAIEREEAPRGPRGYLGRTEEAREADRTQQIRSLTSVRTITATVADQAVAERLRTDPAVTGVEFTEQKLLVRTTESDRIAGALLTEHGAHDLLISAPSLDEAFLQLTAEEPA